ncbi:MFS transporter [Amantichitinum ursilacus]|uniref:Inner membrane protein YbjJ n=1 Tax=Amantichitinum ursilacus TaxID=857265 RepID=A0A0N0XG03_9NEIS|nr:MFS transporter [Amantichitinum ursilacus]KPC49559.1 Inner membrane protein YbjJ [Amantichitinum ursilacus]
MSAESVAWKPACLSTRLVFLVIGVATACWAVMVPYAKIRLQLDDAQLGSILLALGGGAMVAMPLTGHLIKRWGSAQLIRVAGALLVVSIPALALAPTPWALAVLLFIFGAQHGVLDITVNSQAVAVENLAARPLMSSFHGLYSAGGLVGGAVLAALLKSGLSLGVCAVAVGLLCAIACVWSYAALIPHGPADAEEHKTHLAFNHRGVVIIGALCFCAFLTEGAMLDWGAVFLRFERGVNEASAGIGFSVFSVAMAVGRLTGDRIIKAFGPFRVVLGGSLIAAAGVLTIVLAPLPALSVAGFVLVGLGASNIVPVLFGAASRMPGVPASVALPTAVMMGYTGILLGPALVGYVAHATSLPLAFGGISLLMLLITANAWRVRHTAHPANKEAPASVTVSQ